jgi:REP-associated tyrosine transposase
MPRSPRPQVAGGIYHVASRGNRGQPIYGDFTDRSLWLGLLSQTVHECSWLCHSYCQMTNHFHILVETPEANISDGMQSLNSEHAQWFNWRYGYRGHLFQGRFYSELVEDPVHFIELSRYIVLNPVRAGLCARADDWPWSSHAATAGMVERPDFLSITRVLSHFSFDVEQARAAYRTFMTGGSFVRRR